MSQTTTLTEALELPPSSIELPSAAEEDTQGTSNARPEEEFEIEDDANASIAEDESQYPPRKQFIVIFTLLSLVLIASEMSSNVVAVAVPSITDHFHTTSDIGWYSSAYRLTKCSFQFMFGKLYRMFSLKWIFLISMTISLLGAVICATASSSAMFVLGRAVFGLATAGVTSGAFALLVQALPLRKRAMYSGIAAAIESISTLSAPAIGGVIVQKLGWRWCFALPGILEALVWLGTAFFLKDIRTPEKTTWKQNLKELDIIGSIVFLPSLTCLFTALTWGGTKYAWNSGPIIALFCVFVVLLIVFAIDQWVKGDNATLPPRLLKNRTVLSAFAFSVFNKSTDIVDYYLPTYWQVVRGYNPSKAGVLMFPLVVGNVIAFMMQGFGVRISGHFVPFLLAGSVFLPIFSGLMTTLTINTAIYTAILYSGFFGFAVGIGFQAPQVAVQNALNANDVNLGLAIVLFAQNFGPAVSVALSQSIFQNRLSENISKLLPGLSGTNIENMGFGELKRHIEPAKLQELLIGYDRSLTQTWYLAVGVACATLLGSSTMQWRSVKQKRT